MDEDSTVWVVVIAHGEPLAIGETEEEAIEKAGVDERGLDSGKVNVYALSLSDVQDNLAAWRRLERELIERPEEHDHFIAEAPDGRAIAVGSEEEDARNEARKLGWRDEQVSVRGVSSDERDDALWALRLGRLVIGHDHNKPR